MKSSPSFFPPLERKNTTKKLTKIEIISKNKKLCFVVSAVASAIWQKNYNSACRPSRHTHTRMKYFTGARRHDSVIIIIVIVVVSFVVCRSPRVTGARAPVRDCSNRLIIIYYNNIQYTYYYVFCCSVGPTVRAGLL